MRATVVPDTTQDQVERRRPTHLRVTSLTSSCDELWDDFVRGHPDGSPFHLIAWKKSIEDTFQYRSHYLMAVGDRGIDGVLPLFFIRNLLVGKALISSPFAVYGGILANSNEARRALHDHAAALGRELGVEYVELRNAHSAQCLLGANIARYVTFTQDIGPDEDAILEGIPRKTRYMVRKALRHPFQTRRQTTEVSTFERLYAANLRRLGTPSFPRRHFVALLKHFAGSIDIRETLLDGRVIAAVMTFYFRDQVLPYYGACDPTFNAYAPTTFMYFDLMRWAGCNGYRMFDFGRSKKESGSFDFKAHWGMKVRELPYEAILVRRQRVPNYSPNNPRFRLAIKAWQHLPLPMTRVLGPKLLRLIP